MATIEIVETHEAVRTATAVSGKWRHASIYLALAAVPLLAYQLYTTVLWLADGPHQITQFRDSGGVSLYAARFFEVACLLLMILVLRWLVRGCVRERRLTLDALLFIGALISVFWDTIVTFEAPVWLYSTNFVNVNDWWKHAPFNTNPAAGTTAMPIFFLVCVYPGFLVAALSGINTLMRRAQERWAPLTGFWLALATFVTLFLVFIPFCVIGDAFHLVSLADIPPFAVGTDSWRVSLFEPLYAACYGTALASIRYFKDDAGLAITERGLDRLGRLRHPVRLLATTAACCLTVIVMSMIPLLAGKYWAVGYPDLPDQLIGGACDNSATSHLTPYGPCPGTKP